MGLGVPRMFITDRAPIATAEFNNCWCTLMGIKQAMTTVARSSRANAMAEITIQMLTSAIRHCDLTQQSWEAIQQARSAWTRSVHVNRDRCLFLESI